MIITLQRDLSTPNETLGRLTADFRRWDTIEKPWVPAPNLPCGLKGHSCVPAGTYRLERHSSDAHPNVWALVNPQLGVYHWPWDEPKQLQGIARDCCLIHPANFASELEGCIAPGKSRGKDAATGCWRVFDSRDAINELRTLIGTLADLQLIILESK